MIAKAIGSNTTARPAFEPSVVSLHHGGETCLATAPLARSAHPTQPSFLLQTLDGSGGYRSRCWMASRDAANTTSFSNWTTGFSRTWAYREQSLGKLDGVTSQVGATIGDCHILSMSGALSVRRRRVCFRRPPSSRNAGRNSSRDRDVRLRTPACHALSERCSPAATRRAAIPIQSRNNPLSSFEKEARRLRSSSVSPGWHRSKSSRMRDSRQARSSSRVGPRP
jgi:hypothetical protein